MSAAPRRPPVVRRLAPATRAGLTIVEALVALAILAAGVLALIGTTARLAHDEADARRAERASALIAERVETIASAPCRDSAGQRVADGLVERWRVVRQDDVATLVDSVRLPRGARSVAPVAITVPVRCGP